MGLADTGVGDDGVKGGNMVLGFQGLDGGSGVGFRGAVDFYDDEGAGGAFGEGGECFDGGVGRVADAGDDGCVRAGEVGC